MKNRIWPELIHLFIILLLVIISIRAHQTGWIKPTTYWGNFFEKALYFWMAFVLHHFPVITGSNGVDFISCNRRWNKDISALEHAFIIGAWLWWHCQNFSGINWVFFFAQDIFAQLQVFNAVVFFVVFRHRNFGFSKGLHRLIKRWRLCNALNHFDFINFVYLWMSTWSKAVPSPTRKRMISLVLVSFRRFGDNDHHFLQCFDISIFFLWWHPDTWRWARKIWPWVCFLFQRHRWHLDTPCYFFHTGLLKQLVTLVVVKVQFLASAASAIGIVRRWQFWYTYHPGICSAAKLLYRSAMAVFWGRYNS